MKKIFALLAMIVSVSLAQVTFAGSIPTTNYTTSQQKTSLLSAPSATAGTYIRVQNDTPYIIYMSAINIFNNQPVSPGFTREYSNPNWSQQSGIVVKDMYNGIIFSGSVHPRALIKVRYSSYPTPHYEYIVQ